MSFVNPPIHLRFRYTERDYLLAIRAHHTSRVRTWVDTGMALLLVFALLAVFGIFALFAAAVGLIELTGGARKSDFSSGLLDSFLDGAMVTDACVPGEATAGCRGVAHRL